MDVGDDPSRQRPDFVERRGPGWQLITHTNQHGASRLHVVRYDLADAKRVERFSWHIRPDHQTFYAAASVPARLVKTYGEYVYMHRLIMWRSRGKGGRIAHRNGDGLDNRRENLARQNQSEILAKRRPVGGASPYKGVCWDREQSKWIATFRGKKLGRFRDEEEAARAFDDAAFAYWGPGAYLNFPERYFHRRDGVQ